MTRALSHLFSYKYTALYIALIPFINWSLSWMPMYNWLWGMQFSPVMLVIGLVFVVRDFAQREVGKFGIWGAMAVAAVLTYLLAAPVLATVSLIAFLCGESADWAVYTYIRRPLWQRIWISSLISVPIDSIVVMIGIQMALPGLLTWNSLGVLILSKLVGAAVVSYLIRRRERHLAAA